MSWHALHLGMSVQGAQGQALEECMLLRKQLPVVMPHSILKIREESMSVKCMGWEASIDEGYALKLARHAHVLLREFRPALLRPARRPALPGLASCNGDRGAAPVRAPLPGGIAPPDPNPLLQHVYIPLSRIVYDPCQSLEELKILAGVCYQY